MSVSDDLVEECHLEMLHDNMDISRLMVNSQQFEESRLNRKIRDARKTRSYEGGAFKGKLDIQDKSKFKKWLSIQVSYNSPKGIKDRVSNLDT